MYLAEDEDSVRWAWVAARLLSSREICSQDSGQQQHPQKQSLHTLPCQGQRSNTGLEDDSSAKNKFQKALLRCLLHIQMFSQTSATNNMFYVYNFQLYLSNLQYITSKTIESSWNQTASSYYCCFLLSELDGFLVKKIISEKLQSTQIT